MDELKEHQKVITEMQENIGVTEGSLTSLVQDMSEDQTTLVDKDIRNTEMSAVMDKTEIDNAHSSAEINCASYLKQSELDNTTSSVDINMSTNLKENTQNGTSRSKGNRNSKTGNATRVRSQKLCKTQSERKNKFRSRRKDQRIKLSNTDTEADNEADNESRLTNLDEPDIKIHCKAKYIKLEPISKKDLEGIDLYIEVEVDKDLMVSPIEKHDSDSYEKSKYTFKVSSRTESKTCGRAKLQSETVNIGHTGEISDRLKNKRKNDVLPLKRGADKTETVTRNKKSKQMPSTEATIEVHSQAVVSQHGYESETDIEGEGNEILQQTTDNTTVMVSVSEKHNNDDIALENNKKCIRTAAEIQEAKKAGKPKVRRKRETKPKSPRKEGNKVKKETTNQVDYTTRITEEGDKMFGCPVCTYESKYSQNIRSHYLIHTNVKPWICEICGSSFVSKCNLRHHMVAHSNDRPFKCSTCGMGFKQKVVLQQHVARHKEDKQFVCEQCGKGFCISGDLKKHIRTHTGEKPYQCETCLKQFSDNSSYARHRYIHQEMKNYACTHCNKRFSRQDMCNSHMKTHNDNKTGMKDRKSKVKRTRKSVDAGNIVVGESVEIENVEVAPREHLYHIENYAKEIQERTYTEMNPTGDFTVVNNGYGQQQPHQQQPPNQGIQIYPQRQETTVQESYPREYSTMWTTNLHFY